MPIYEYQCQKCGTIEVTQRITEKTLTKCPTCKSKVKRLISNTSFQLKGTGWYITDYARKGQTNGDSKSDDSSKSASSSSESKSDNGSKPSAASESKSEAKKTETKKSESFRGGDKSSSTSSTAST